MPAWCAPVNGYVPAEAVAPAEGSGAVARPRPKPAATPTAASPPPSPRTARRDRPLVGAVGSSCGSVGADTGTPLRSGARHRRGELGEGLGERVDRSGELLDLRVREHVVVGEAGVERALRREQRVELLEPGGQRSREV